MYFAFSILLFSYRSHSTSASDLLFLNVWVLFIFFVDKPIPSKKINGMFKINRLRHSMADWLKWVSFDNNKCWLAPVEPHSRWELLSADISGEKQSKELSRWNGCQLPSGLFQGFRMQDYEHCKWFIVF